MGVGGERGKRRGGERTKGSDLMLCQRREEKSWGEETLGDEGRKRREGGGGGVPETQNRERERERGRQERGLEQGKGRGNLTETEKSRREKKRGERQQQRQHTSFSLPLSRKALGSPPWLPLVSCLVLLLLKRRRGRQDERSQEEGGGLDEENGGGWRVRERTSCGSSSATSVHPSIHPRAVTAECCS